MSVFYIVKICNGINELKSFIEYVNDKQHKIVSVTQNERVYTIIYEVDGNL